MDFEYEFQLIEYFALLYRTLFVGGFTTLEYSTSRIL